ncbi:6-O-methylguanine DNA methyltransferase [Methanocella sp. CWC-04]|uniref:methylated-DNA--[protein]-cysteine S-methyltransferase n=2 Tax=Methanooceanicella nereidis TaxID=2052831 RepID=A0AAP2W5Q8_9EURY|nr:6-O-methylguanine DNA methyltransferase [Methanocella sp. CWC-04]
MVLELEGDVIKKLSFQSEKPNIRRTSSEVVKDLEEYFDTGKIDMSKYRTDLSGLTEFEKRVLKATSDIPPGKTMAYSEVAKAAGNPGAARAVGNVLAKNPFPVIIPCHRVVAKNSIGGFTGDINVKIALLKLEGAIKQ